MRSYRVWVNLEPNETVVGIFRAKTLTDLIATVRFLKGCKLFEGSEGIHKMVSPKGVTFWVEG